jgi:hypothetical protein
MSFETFMRDPKGYLQTHQVYINTSLTSAGSMTAGAAEAIPTALGHSGMQWTLNGTTFITLNHMNAPATVTDQIKGVIPRPLGRKIRRDYSVTAAGTADTGIRYLPFRDNHVTYMELDVGASFFITGPLTGCTVAVGTTSTTPPQRWIIHANSNASTNLQAAKQYKRNMAVWAFGKVNVPQANVKWCEYGEQYRGQGFVFGLPRDGAWKFYVHDNDFPTGSVNLGGVISNTNKFAEL